MYERKRQGEAAGISAVGGIELMVTLPSQTFRAEVLSDTSPADSEIG